MSSTQDSWEPRVNITLLMDLGRSDYGMTVCLVRTRGFDPLIVHTSSQSKVGNQEVGFSPGYLAFQTVEAWRAGLGIWRY
jgi:hypothetical protein